MKRLVWTLAVSALVAFAGQANAGEMFFTAYKDGKQTEVMDPKTKKSLAGKQIRVYNQAEFDKLADTKKKDNAETATMCNAKYYLSKKDTEWVKAHEAAKHEIRVRDHVAKGKYEVVCPKDAAAPPMKKEEPPKKPDPKKTT